MGPKTADRYPSIRINFKVYCEEMDGSILKVQSDSIVYSTMFTVLFNIDVLKGTLNNSCYFGRAPTHLALNHVSRHSAELIEETLLR